MTDCRGMAVNLAVKRAMAELDRRLPIEARVLAVGVGASKRKLEKLLDGREVVGLDIDPSHRPDVVADAHRLPFGDGEFDAVVAQAVLDHVHDPFRVVQEIHRVLRPDGLLYSEIPFMQQVHEGAHDYMRFTLAGHRVLLRDFRELKAGSVAGPGTVMVWAIEHLLLSVTNGRALKPVKGLVRVCFGWLALLDFLLAERPAGLDAASCTYFLGVRSDEPRPVQEIVVAFSGRRSRRFERP